MRAVRAWLGTPPGIVLSACMLAVGLRLPFVGLAPYTDEGGLLVVARHWHEGGHGLYGWLFVDRPPILLLYFQLAGTLGGITEVRLLALGLVAVIVASAGWAGLLLGGRRGAACAAFVAAALVADPALGTLEVNGETVGAPLTMLGCALLVRVYAGTPVRPLVRATLLAAAGVAGVCALLVKQNLTDALVFGLVLTLASATRRTWRAALADLGWFVAGALVPTTTVLVWAQAESPGVADLWFTLFQFRIDALRVIAGQPTGAPEARLSLLLNASVVSGLLLVLVVSLWALRRRLWARDPLTLALSAMIAAETVGVLAGGSYWTHYLLGLVPGAALLAARAAGGLTRARLLSAAVGVAVVSSIVHTGGVAMASAPPSGDSQLGALDGWLNEASKKGDTGLVVYGDANIFATTRLHPEYPYLWTLPMRTLDPHLNRLVRLLDHRDAPTFVIQRMPPDSWGIDPHGRVDRALSVHYRLVGRACDIPVYLHDGLTRHVPTRPVHCPA
jgi:4-amino-4-deoxy-L-arabinose transferase-like glycosyltransferase